MFYKSMLFLSSPAKDKYIPTQPRHTPHINYLYSTTHTTVGDTI